MLKNLFLFFLFSFLPLHAATLSLDEMISQMVVVGFDGQKEGDKWVEQIAKDIKRGKIGGVILDDKNIQNMTQLKKLTQYLKAQTSSLPLLVITEQEGGEHSAFETKKGFTRFPSAYEMASSKDITEASSLYQKMSLELASSGINVNLAPVLDLSPKVYENDIRHFTRSFSSYEEIVTTYASLAIDAFKDANVTPVVKYFPNAGSNLWDDFSSEVDLTQGWRFEQLKPYYDLIGFAKIDAILVSHGIHKDLDAEFPAVLSEKIIQKLLRDKMHFEGIVIANQLRTSSISSKFDFKQRIIRAVNAGVDILVFENYFADNASMPFAVQKIIQDAIKSGEIPKEKILSSYERIKSYKEKLSKKSER